MERQRRIRQQEIEERLIEEETARRVEELVAKRVEEELEKRKDEIEREVLRRVEEAKRIMEKQLLEELEKQRQAELAAQKAREVTCMWTGKTKYKLLLMLIQWVGFPLVLLEVGLFHTTYTHFAVHVSSIIEANI